MRKSFLLTALCLTSLAGYSQIFGKRVDGPVQINGYSIAEGDTLHFGRGTMPSGNFKYIAQPVNVFAGSAEMSLHRSFSGRTLIVKDLRESKSKRMGQKVLAVVNPGGFNYAVELEDAIATGEIVAINSRRMGQASATVASAGSVADELIKLKQLLDAGAISQDEYNTQKKKILDK